MRKANTILQVSFKVHGTVQGVGFRDFTQKCATSYDLRGWVEGEAQGPDDIMQKFFQQVSKGPRMAHVVKLEKQDLEPRDGEDHFSVMRTAASTFESGH
ncbi:acylphosphatase [Penicillium brevicompactum]|uniref:acylphosphatase n=1 Tax=Penicillium brevicompactum TaxID=5074 RepID=UPI002540629E|nr:acylphosphatase [Penicillium brevicompactum]KAJ5347338.1 acylphosphatase [Penicillium brevicompactum]